MKKTVVALLSVLFAVSANAQENQFFPTRKGAELTYKYYNHRGKALKDAKDKARYATLTVEDVWPDERETIINVAIASNTIDLFADSERFKAVAANMSYGDVKIDRDSVTFDNTQMIDGAFTPATIMELGYFQISYEMDFIAVMKFPRGMKVGDTLPDRKVFDGRYIPAPTEEQQKKLDETVREVSAMMAVNRARLSHFQPREHPVAISMRNGRVEAFEKVETPAGSFDCYKISYELHRGDPDNPRQMPAHTEFMSGTDVIVVSSAGIVIEEEQEQEVSKFIDWYSPEIGLVKREKLNRKGKKAEEVMRLESYK